LAVGSETGPIGRSAFPEKEGLKSSQQEEKSTARNGCATKAEEGQASGIQKSYCAGWKRTQQEWLCY
jgi:hypothetical protein